MWKNIIALHFAFVGSLPPLPCMTGVNSVWQVEKNNCFVYWCRIGWSFPFLKSLCFISASIFSLSLFIFLFAFPTFDYLMLLFFYLTSLRFIDFDFSVFLLSHALPIYWLFLLIFLISSWPDFIAHFLFVPLVFGFACVIQQKKKKKNREKIAFFLKWGCRFCRWTHVT